jgi:hypothetical protein
MPASANALSVDSGEIVLDDVPVSSSNDNDVCLSQNSALHFKSAEDQPSPFLRPLIARPFIVLMI